MAVEDVGVRMVLAGERCAAAEEETMFARLDAQQTVDRATGEVQVMHAQLQEAHEEIDSLRVRSSLPTPLYFTRLHSTPLHYISLHSTPLNSALLQLDSTRPNSLPFCLDLPTPLHSIPQGKVR